MYDTYVRIAIASGYSREAYANALETFHQKQHHMTILFPFNRYVHKISFLMLWNSNEDTAKTIFLLVTHI